MATVQTSKNKTLRWDHKGPRHTNEGPGARVGKNKKLLWVVSVGELLKGPFSEFPEGWDDRKTVQQPTHFHDGFCFSCLNYNKFRESVVWL